MKLALCKSKTTMVMTRNLNLILGGTSQFYIKNHKVTDFFSRGKIILALNDKRQQHESKHFEHLRIKDI